MIGNKIYSILFYSINDNVDFSLYDLMFVRVIIHILLCRYKCTCITQLVAEVHRTSEVSSPSDLGMTMNTSQ